MLALFLAGPPGSGGSGGLSQATGDGDHGKHDGNHVDRKS